MEIAIPFAVFSIRKSAFTLRYFTTLIGAAVRYCKGRGAYEIGKHNFIFWIAGKSCCSNQFCKILRIHAYI